MTSLDKHYYETFDQIGSPFYDWERQLINLGCNVADIDIDNSTNVMTDDGKKQFSILVHEYIHFLQNFATAWGVPVFTDFSLAIMKIGASSATSKEELQLPLVIATLKSPMLIDGITLRENVIQRINKCNNSQYHDNGLLTTVSLTNPNNNCSVLTNGRVTVELGLKIIREHMAHMGTQLFLGKTDDEIHNYNKTIGGFKFNGIEFSRKPEYWILYEYLFEANLFTELARGVFYLMQQCLITLNPELALLRFMNWFQKCKSNYVTKTDFVKVVEDWLKDKNEIYFFYVGFTQSIKHCEDILDLSKKSINKHDIFRFTHNITEYALNNIQKTKGGRFLFNPTDNFADIKYWKNKIALYGTGMVRYLDSTLIHGTIDHCNNMTDSFNFLVSSSLVIKKILENQKTTCPFLNDIPICDAEYKGDNNCYRNPFLMIQNDASGKECLFANGVILLGMSNRVKFSN
jgi:hypothetical protein